jgi:hypothetical protein
VDKGTGPEEALKEAGLFAVRALVNALNDRSPTVRLRAATTILKFFREDERYERLNERAARLEKILKTAR